MILPLAQPYSTERAAEQGQLLLSGQHDRTPVTTKHEKRLYANPLFAMSYGSFQGRPLRQTGGVQSAQERAAQRREQERSHRCAQAGRAVTRQSTQTGLPRRDRGAHVARTIA